MATYHLRIKNDTKSSGKKVSAKFYLPIAILGEMAYK